MRIIAQSQVPTKSSYLHLAYLSAQLTNWISKGELMSMGTLLGVAVAGAAVCSVAAAKLARAGQKLRAMKIWAMAGFIGIFGGIWLVEILWSETRSDEQVAQHVVNKYQWWAMRNEPIATAVESLATTNAKAAVMAAQYYLFSGHHDEFPEKYVKSLRFGEIAESLGRPNSFGGTNILEKSSPGRAYLHMEEALKRNQMSAVERAWATQKLAQINAYLAAEEQKTATK